MQSRTQAHSFIKIRLTYTSCKIPAQWREGEIVGEWESGAHALFEFFFFACCTCRPPFMFFSFTSAAAIKWQQRLTISHIFIARVSLCKAG